ncbi:hypothetical protein EHQ16_09055 [Leptospira kanakyensis]|uniref:DUF3426 domain-containing protein n=1 Tax=Leptospira kanakyensis TaxID=2484968 RepID=A0A6N4QQ05_9LEPT|nr:hypothetical protein [Leptospira kanakyensis]TGK55498.1 hypothetical protein EHQ11_01230 [Leptospira kanakyensis]TGK61032.1 hypothetical protein EHQ16_09055 [Leptospira kanakyensis]TGK76495.1 hypothetical protein EHQ18_00595 [Leptospira kanakyensis]
MSSKQCPSCGSTNIYQESATTYRCGDCFDKLPTGSTVELPPPKVYGTSKQNSQTGSLGNWKNLMTGIVVAWLVLGSSVFTYFQNMTSGSGSSQDKNVTIQIDPNLESIEINPEGEFQFTSALPDVIGNVYVVGKFTNKSGQNLLMPKFTVDLQNAEGTSLTSGFGYSEKSIVPNGDSASFLVLIEKAPNYDHYDISVTATTIPEHKAIQELSLKQIDFKRNQYKEIVMFGKIQNRSNTIANSTRITCLLLDKKDQSIDYESVSLEKEDFLPKESQNFQIIFSRTKQIPNSYYCETNSSMKNNE